MSAPILTNPRKICKPHPVSNILLNGGGILCGGSWLDRWINVKQIERVGSFIVSDEAGEIGEVEFRAIITLGKMKIAGAA